MGGANCRQLDCSGHGIAQGSVCLCDDGYAGDACEKTMKKKPHRCSVYCVHNCLRKCEGTFANKELPAYRGCFNNCTNDCFGNCMTQPDFWYSKSVSLERAHPDKVPIPQEWVDDITAKYSK